MNKKSLLLVVFLLFTSSIVLAVDMPIESSYSPGTTLITQIQGNIISSIKHEDVGLYDGRKLVAVDYDIKKLGDNYFVYVVLPLDVKSYDLKIKNIHFFEQGRENWTNLTRTINVSGNVANFSVSPGIIVTNSDFVITIKNLGGDIVASLDLSGTKGSYNIGYGRVKDITVPIGNIPKSGLYTLSVSSGGLSYHIPVLVLKESQIIPNSSDIKPGQPFRLGPNDLSLEILRGAQKYLNLTIENLGSEVIDKISLSYSKDLSNILRIDNIIIENLSAYTIRNIGVFIQGSGFVNDYEGSITASSNNYSDSTKVYINVVDEINKTAQTSDNITTGNLLSCISMSGIRCYPDEFCQGNYTNSIEGLCCMGSCVSKIKGNSSGSSSSMIWVIIVLLFVGVLVWLYTKYKSPAKTPDKKIGDLTKKFDNQFKTKEE